MCFYTKSRRPLTHQMCRAQQGFLPCSEHQNLLQEKKHGATISRLLLILPQVPKRIQTSGKQARGILFMTYHQYFRGSKIFTVNPTEGQTHLQQQQMNHRIAGWFGTEGTSKLPPTTPSHRQRPQPPAQAAQIPPAQPWALPGPGQSQLLRATCARATPPSQ